MHFLIISASRKEDLPLCKGEAIKRPAGPEISYKGISGGHLASPLLRIVVPLNSEGSQGWRWHNFFPCPASRAKFFLTIASLLLVAVISTLSLSTFQKSLRLSAQHPPICSSEQMQTDVEFVDHQGVLFCRSAFQSVVTSLHYGCSIPDVGL